MLKQWYSKHFINFQFFIKKRNDFQARQKPIIFLYLYTIPTKLSEKFIFILPTITDSYFFSALPVEQQIKLVLPYLSFSSFWNFLDDFFLKWKILDEKSLNFETGNLVLTSVLGGRFLIVSLAQQHIVQELMQYFGVGFSIHIHGMKQDGSGDIGSKLPVFIFIITKLSEKCKIIFFLFCLMILVACVTIDEMLLLGLVKIKCLISFI